MALLFNDNFNGSFRENPFVIGSSISSPIVPIICISNYIGVGEGEINYYKPLSRESDRIYRFKMPDFLDYLNNNIELMKFDIGGSDESTVIKVGKGYIADDNDNILLSLGVTNKNFFDWTYQRREYGRTIMYNPALKELPISKDLCLLVSNTLVVDKKYALFYKKLCASYINDAYINDIEVRFVTSEKIEELNYSNEFSLRFNTIEQLQSHLESAVPQIFFLNDSSYSSGNVNPGLNYLLSERNNTYVPPVTQELNPISELTPNLNPFPIEDLRERIKTLSGYEGEQVTQWETSLPSDYIMSADVATDINPSVFINSDTIVVNPTSSIDLIDDTDPPF